MSSDPAPAATCELLRQNGDPCGVLAIGRCIDCSRAFCTTHQARYRDNFGDLVPYVDLCTDCYNKRLAAEKATSERAIAQSMAPMRYFTSGDARAALLAAGVPTVDIFDIQRREEAIEGLFRRRSHIVEVLTHVGTGWILGELRWAIDRHNDFDNRTYREDGVWLTALVNEPDARYTERTAEQIRSFRDAAQDWSRRSGGQDRSADAGTEPTDVKTGHPFIRVSPHPPRGYWRLPYEGGEFGRDWGDWEKARQAVQRLIGQSITHQ